jgi:hypothetical protein
MFCEQMRHPVASVALVLTLVFQSLSFDYHRGADEKLQIHCNRTDVDGSHLIMAHDGVGTWSGMFIVRCPRWTVSYEIEPDLDIGAACAMRMKPVSIDTRHIVRVHDDAVRRPRDSVHTYCIPNARIDSIDTYCLPNWRDVDAIVWFRRFFLAIYTWHARLGE